MSEPNDDTAPDRFYVGYEDDAKFQRLMAQVGGDVDAVDPADYWDIEEAGNSHIGAISKARARARQHGATVTLYERRNIIHNNLYAWDWETRTLETIDPDGTRYIEERPEKVRTRQ